MMPLDAVENYLLVQLSKWVKLKTANKELKMRSLVKLSGLVKSMTKMVTGCLRMTKVAIFVVLGCGSSKKNDSFF